MIGNSFLSSRI